MYAIVVVLPCTSSHNPDTYFKVLQLMCDTNVETLAEALFTFNGARRLPLRGVDAHSGPPSYHRRMTYLAGVGTWVGAYSIGT